MQIMDISQRKFNRLKELELPDYIYNTESKLYHYNYKLAWEKKRALIKKFIVSSGESFSNKLYNINTLIDNSSIIGLDTLVMPETLVSIDNEICGYIMPYIENRDFHVAMINNFHNVDKKVFYLKQIGALLHDMKNIRQYYLKDNFYLGDIHENNFIINKDDRVMAVDLDSCYIKNGNAFPSRILYESTAINDFPNKYPKNEFFNIPNENTDIYCYIMMILNTFTGMQMHEEDEDTYYYYLQYLFDLGFDRELLDIFSLVYENADNVNPYEYLETIPQIAYKANINIYKMRYK